MFTKRRIRVHFPSGKAFTVVFCPRSGGWGCSIRRAMEVSGLVAAKEGYCVKCKEKREIKDAQAITMKNGRPATQGLCPTCGTKIFKIGK